MNYFLRNPVACGITSLGLDHCSILGYTYDEIAWQKSGIFKESCIAFTVDQTNKSTYEVMKNRANELKVNTMFNSQQDKQLNNWIF